MNIDWDPISEHQAGILCGEGFMKERYDESIDDLIRTFTPKGIKVIKDILKDPEYKKSFVQMVYKETEGLPIEVKVGIIEEIKRMLR